MTEPAGTVGLKSLVSVPTVRPSPTISWSASLRGRFRMSGTATATLPRDTVTATSEPSATVSPSAGSCVRTMPGSMSVRSSVP